MVESKHVNVIAEIGVNHDGYLDKAKRLIEAAKLAGADAVKFQSFDSSKLVTARARKVSYQRRDRGSSTHQEMLQRLELSRDDQQEIFRFCGEIGIEFMSTPYGLSELEFLLQLGIERIKLASADITDIPLQEAAAASGKISLVSTGMADISEITRVVGIHDPSNLCLLVCTSSYPTEPNDVRIRRITLLREKFRVPVGFSDHSESETSAIAAIALGASVVEKHLTLDRNDDGPDHLASYSPREFAHYVQSIREAEKVLSGDTFGASENELEMQLISRKSVHLASSLRRNERLELRHLTLMRPNEGLGWYEAVAMIGARATCDLAEGHPLRAENFRK